MKIAPIPAIPYDVREDKGLCEFVRQLNEIGWAYLDALVAKPSVELPDTREIIAYGKSYKKRGEGFRIHKAVRIGDRTTERISVNRRIGRSSKHYVWLDDLTRKIDRSERPETVKQIKAYPEVIREIMRLNADRQRRDYREGRFTEDQVALVVASNVQSVLDGDDRYFNIHRFLCSGQDS